MKKSKRKTLQEKIAEKERLKREEALRRLKEQEEEEISPEERLRRQQESDLKLALETTFGADGEEKGLMNGLSMPTSTEEFDEFTENLSKKLQLLSKHSEYPNFCENLVRNLCATSKILNIKYWKKFLINYKFSFQCPL